MQDERKTLSIRPLLFTFALFLLLAVFVRHQISPIEPKDGPVSETEFSAQNAFAMLQTLTKEQVPHPVDSEANRLVEKRLISILRKMGYQEEIQDTKICEDSSKGVARCTRVRNVIVHIPGTSKNKGILLSAHYDSVPAGPGGSDAGAAVGTLLEAARLLTKQSKPLNSVTLLFNEGEEFGLFGARAFMEKHPLAKKIQVAINIEARGTTGQSVMFETGEDSAWLIKHYSKTTPAPLSSSLFYEVYKFLPNNTDLTIYKDHGLQGLNFAHAERLPHYHTPLDNLANLDKGSLQHHGENVWGVLKSILSEELDTVEKGNLVYTDILGLFIVQWDETTSIWLCLALVVLLALVLVRIKRQARLNFNSILKTMGGVLLILVGSALTAFLIQKLVLLLASSDKPWHANNLPMQISIWVGVSLTGLTLAKWLSKNSTPLNIGIGVLTTWLIFSLVTSIYLPGISFLFILPCSVGLLALLVTLFLPVKNRNGQFFTVETWALIIIALSAAFLFIPIAYVLEIMVGYEMAIAIAVILSFIISSCMPLLALTSESNKSLNKLVFVHLIVVVIASSWTILQAPFTPWMPMALNINYLQNEEGNASIIWSERQLNQPSELSRTLNNNQLLASIPWSKYQLNTSKIAPVNIESLDIEASNINTSNIEKLHLSIVNETIKESSRSVHIKINTEVHKLSDVRIFIPTKSALQSITSETQSLNYKGESSIRNGYFEYHCRGQSCSKLDLTLNFSSLNKTKVLVVKVLQGLPEHVQYLTEKRGENATQRHDGDQSIILSEFDL